MAHEPLTPAGLDLRDFDWMPLEVKRLRDSDLSVLAPGDAFRAAVLLWCAAWHQVPAGSLPSDDRLLANLVGYGRDLEGWSTIKADAMRGFIECSDGRLYHPLVCEKALEADEQRNKQRKRTQAATSARRNGQRDDDRNDSPKEERNDVHLTLPNPTLPKVSKTAAKPQPRANEAIDDLKRVYPKRKGNYGWKAAERKLNSLIKTGVDPKVIIAAAVRLCETLSSRVGTEFIPMPASWLNSEDFVESAVAAFDAGPQPVDWDTICSMFKKFGMWSKHAPGPGPESPACQCPLDILLKHGIPPPPIETPIERPPAPLLRAM